ncbi:hypothetical protein J6590_033824 [Homalodisca vitripennis]|nr:hypothetical protein J6590_033824 [Homalodisca vitripennis]
MCHILADGEDSRPKTHGILVHLEVLYSRARFYEKQIHSRPTESLFTAQSSRPTIAQCNKADNGMEHRDDTLLTDKTASAAVLWGEEGRANGRQATPPAYDSSDRPEPG